VTPRPTSTLAVAPPPWYRQKTTVSYTDIVAALRRDLIRHDFWAQAPPMTTNPKLSHPKAPPQTATG
jgi:hypothetical protein